MKNKAFTLPSINSSPAINTFVSTWDSYYLHIQTLHVPDREGSHRLWLHQDLFVYYSIQVWEGCSRYYLNNEKALKPCLEIKWSRSSAHHRQPPAPLHRISEQTGWKLTTEPRRLKNGLLPASKPEVTKVWHQTNSCAPAEVPETWIMKSPT